MTINVSRVDGLVTQEWEFIYVERLHAVCFTAYTRSTLPSARHRKPVVEEWSTYRRHNNVTDRVVPPKDVEAEALEIFTKGLVVKVDWYTS